MRIKNCTSRATRLAEPGELPRSSGLAAARFASGPKASRVSQETLCQHLGRGSAVRAKAVRGPDYC
eukprot:3538077-Alexandrium_andersonii.AAC.1